MLETTHTLAGRRILLVEDEFMIAEIMEEWLHLAGAEVIGPVPCVEEALELIGDRGPLDGAVLDVNLGQGETVYPVADDLSERGIPYLFATGDIRIIDDPVHRQRPRLEKPVAKQQLLGALEQLLAVHPVAMG